MKKLKMKLVGIRPLILHNERLANPMDPITRELKKLTGIPGKQRTEDIIEQIRHLEWRGGLYLDENGAPSVTDDMIAKVIIEGARKTKRGKQAEAGVFVDKPYFPIKHDGPKTVEKLYEDERFVFYRTVVTNGGRVMRARPRFPSWEVDVELSIDDAIINVGHVQDALSKAGETVGMGNWRPRYGRFMVE